MLAEAAASHSSAAIAGVLIGPMNAARKVLIRAEICCRRGKIVDSNTVPQFADWRALDVQGLVAGRIGIDGQRLKSEVRVWDVVDGQLWYGSQFFSAPQEWRKLAHVIAIPSTSGSPARRATSQTDPARTTSIANCRRSAGCACRLLQARSSRWRRRCGMTFRRRTACPAPRRHLRPPKAR
jgi:TolB amino-terminal domain